VATVGVTSGASVPEVLVQDVLGWLTSHGRTTVEDSVSTVGIQRFAMPRALARTGRTAAQSPVN
jgi:4-hydroxy-3-methylbut-2-en-1-yl diphosphate reductase